MSIVTTDDLATYLGTTVNADRAQMLIDDAIAQALSIVTVGTVPSGGPTEDNLPSGAAALVRAAAARLYLNPAGTTTEAAGPFSLGRPASSGSMYSKAERATLRRLAGRTSGAFTVDPTASSALDDYSDPLAQPTAADVIELLQEEGIA